MKTRGNMSAVIDGLQREHGLLVAYLEATDKFGWRALHKPMATTETPKPVSVEAHQVSAAPQSPEVVPPTSPFVLRRANLVRIRPRTWISENGEPSATAPSHSRICVPQVEMVQRAPVRFPPLARLTEFMDGAARRLEAATAPMRAAVRFLPLARLTEFIDGAARRLEAATAPMRAAVRFLPLARLTAFMEGVARSLETATAPVQTQRKFAVFVVACLVVASFAGTYFHYGITAVLAQYPAHSDMLPSELAGASRQTDSQEASLSRKASEDAKQRQAVEVTVTEVSQSLQQEREKMMALEQQAKAARLPERRNAELQPGARRDQTHGPQPSSSVRHHRARSRCFGFLCPNPVLLTAYRNRTASKSAEYTGW